MAEYHDPFLRRVLSKYVTKVVSPDAGAQVFDDDKAFHEAVGKYKQVVTHYFQCRAQTRVLSLSAPVWGLIDWKMSTEWAKGRGAAHVHMLILEES
jgi:Ser-tRNA(Ala) deacylase AlaX